MEAPRRVVAGALLLQAVAGLALGLPGHLSVDSIVQLYEARTLQFISFHPPMMSLLLRALDACVPGTALFVALDQALLTAAFALVLAQRRTRIGWLEAAAAALVALNPLLVVYTGIVWKDVLMAHLAAFGYACLYAASNRLAGRGRAAWALAGVLAVALVASLRQHGLLIAIPGAAYAAFLLAERRAWRAGFALGLCAAVIAVNVAIVEYADSVGVGEKIARARVGVRSLVYFDFAGIVAHGGAIPDPDVNAQVAATQAPFYTPLNVGLLPDPAPHSPLRRMHAPELLALWARSIADSPSAYLAHRWAYFGALTWRSGTEPGCPVIQVGVEPSVYVPYLGRDIVPELGIARPLDRRDRELAERVLAWRGSPMFNHVFWLGVLAAAAALLAWRRGAGALVALAASTIAFALAFAVIGIACDFRYLYVVPVAATLCAFAVAVNRSPLTSLYNRTVSEGGRSGVPPPRRDASSLQGAFAARPKAPNAPARL